MNTFIDLGRKWSLGIGMALAQAVTLEPGAFRDSGECLGEPRDGVSLKRALIGDGLREAAPPHRDTLRTGIRHWDQALEGGLTTGVLCELVMPSPSCGGQSMLLRLLAVMRSERRFAALVDGRDTFDPQTAPSALLEHLLWVRCVSAKQAIQAADLLLRDENLGMVLVDLRDLPARDVGWIRSSQWYRLQRLARQFNAVLAVFTARAMIPSAQVRLELKGNVSLDDNDSGWNAFADRIRFDVLRLRKVTVDAFKNLVAVG